MSEHKPVRPEDVLPDGIDSGVLNGVQVRKGSVAAFVANAKALDHLPLGAPGREAIVAQLRTLIPVVAAVGVFEVFEPRSPELRALVATPSPCDLASRTA